MMRRTKVKIKLPLLSTCVSMCLSECQFLRSTFIFIFVYYMYICVFIMCISRFFEADQMDCFKNQCLFFPMRSSDNLRGIIFPKISKKILHKVQQLLCCRLFSTQTAFNNQTMNNKITNGFLCSRLFLLFLSQVVLVRCSTMLCLFTLLRCLGYRKKWFKSREEIQFLFSTSLIFSLGVYRVTQSKLSLQRNQ